MTPDGNKDEDDDMSEVMIKINRANYQVVLVEGDKIVRTMPGVCNTIDAARESAETWAIRNSYYCRREPLRIRND